MERLRINHGGKENLMVGQEMKIDYELFNLSKYCELYTISVCYYVKDEFKWIELCYPIRVEILIYEELDFFKKIVWKLG